jgi:hypothetical protein
LTTPLPTRLDASAFPVATPLNAFFAWNEARYPGDRRYIIARDIYRLLENSAEHRDPLAHLLGQPVIRRRFGQRVVVSATRLRAARAGIEGCQGSRRCDRSSPRRHPAGQRRRPTSPHAAVFQAFEVLARQVDLEALAKLRPCREIDLCPGVKF